MSPPVHLDSIKRENGENSATNHFSRDDDSSSESSSGSQSSRNDSDSANDGENNNNNGNNSLKSEPSDNNGYDERSQDVTRSSDESDRKSSDDDDEDDKPLAMKIQVKKEETKYKEESDDEDDIPLAKKMASKKKRTNSDSDDDYKSPVKSSPTKGKAKKRAKGSDDESDFEEKKKRKKTKKATSSASKRKRKSEPDESDIEEKPKKPSKKKRSYDSDDNKHKSKKGVKSESESPTKGRKKKEEDTAHVWRWWEEDNIDLTIKWKTLQHKGPVFAPLYEPLPDSVKFYYDGKPMKLTEGTEEVATFYAKMLDHDYTSKEAFNTNFFKDWRKTMTAKERETITSLKKCDFKDMAAYFKEQTELRKQRGKEEKLRIKEENERAQNEYGYCIVDGHKQKIANFKIEPPGLFRGRGDHPKMGKVKRRTTANDVIINIGKKAVVPTPPPNERWKEVRHDNTVTWLVSWTENVMGNIKYIMLNPSSKLKSMKDWQKYEKARELHNCVDKIRRDYMADFKAREMMVRQRAVALYFIDKLALRAGNEKEEGEAADTVGCCSLRVEHIKLDKEKDGQKYVVSFDFLGKDSIRYLNSIGVEKRVFKSITLFMENKQPSDDLFDRLNTATLNKYLNTLMEGLTAKVFRTYNASKTLQEQLDKLTKEDMSQPEKMLAYNRANRAVAVLCNHQRAVPKTFEKQMENLTQKLKDKSKQIKDVKKELKGSKGDPKLKKKLQTLEEQMKKLEVAAVDKEENKQIALGTSKLNYLDPRITVAWCKKHDVPVEKMFNRTQRDKFRWAIEMAGPDYRFYPSN